MRISRLIIPAIVVVVVIVVIVFRDRLSGSASDLRVGDCFEVPAGDSISDVQHRPCTEAHDGEVFVIRDFTGSDTYPTKDQFDAWVLAECADKEFPSYVGASYESRQDIDIGYLYPKQENWGSGDRQMICYLSPTNGQTVTTSFKKATP